MEFIKGYLLGLGMIVFIGPVFFLLLSISLHQGTRAGVAVAFGIVVSDIIAVSLCYFGVTAFLYESESKSWLALTGGILLVILGLKYLFHPSHTYTDKNDLPSLSFFACFVKGFLVNFVNPFVFFVWIGVVTYERELEAIGYNPLLYFSGVLSAILCTDLIKAFSASKIKAFLSNRALVNLYRISGVVLIAFGVRMFLLLV